MIRIRGISYHMKVHNGNTSQPALVMLHGFMGSGDLFNQVIEGIQQDCNPITVDLLGHGETEGAELPYRFSTREQVADLSKLIREQCDTPVFLYGYSMGARLSLQLALAQPELFQGLILESGTFGIESESERQMRQSLDASRADDISSGFDRFLKKWDQFPLFKTPNSKPLTARQKAMRARQEPRFMANALLGFGTGSMPCVRDRLSELKMPVLLLVGEEDAKFHRINHTMARAIPNARLWTIPESGHRPHLDQPEEVASELITFIHSHALPRKTDQS